jgi:hypothetical protein
MMPDRMSTKQKLRRRLSHWRRRVSWLWLRRNRHSCIKCGFLSFDGGEASTDVRLTVAAEGKTGWFVKEQEDAVDCFKHLWSREIYGYGPDTAIFEANRPRFRCAGFHRHVPGRPPNEHLKLEDEDREFRRKFILVLVPPLIAVLGGLVVGFKLALGAAVIALAGLWAGLKHH